MSQLLAGLQQHELVASALDWVVRYRLPWAAVGFALGYPALRYLLDRTVFEVSYGVRELLQVTA